MKISLRILILFIILTLILLQSCSPGEEKTENTDPVSSDEQSNIAKTDTLHDSDAVNSSAEETTGYENGYCVCIDAGHQQKGIPEKEPNGPGSSVLKAKLSSGTRGVSTGIPEYVLTLEVSLMLKEELLLRGYKVVMIRETHDCPISNAKRAITANESGADIFVRIHANGSSDPKVKGALTCAPTFANEFLSAGIIGESRRLSKLIVDSLCASTGALNRGIYGTDTMTGINWCRIPVTIVEMGYMSNIEEDELMATDGYRRKIVDGIANGIDAYFE